MEAFLDYKNGTLGLIGSADEIRLILTSIFDAPDVIEILNRIESKQETLRMTQQEELVLLQTIDASTTKIGVNVTAIGATATTISTEVDALVAKAAAAGVSPEIVAALAALGSKSQSISDATDALVPVLNAIATKGADNPVPVPVPEPTPNPAG